VLLFTAQDGALGSTTRLEACVTTLAKEKQTMSEYPKAIFLDRDGTINPDEFGYINNPEGYSLYPYAADAIKQFRDMGYLVFLVTNQGGVARGYITLEQMHSVLKRAEELLAEQDTYLDKIYYSPYYHAGVVEPWNIQHEDRKPGLGMFKKALAEFRFRPEHSWMIGDRYSDIEFGIKAGLKTILLRSGNGEQEFIHNMPGWVYQPDFVVNDLLSAALLIARF
jgi:D,D-heptose 1,7-bisphosphate phosphatase